MRGLSIGDPARVGYGFYRQPPYSGDPPASAISRRRHSLNVCHRPCLFQEPLTMTRRLPVITTEIAR